MISPIAIPTPQDYDAKYEQEQQIIALERADRVIKLILPLAATYRKGCKLPLERTLTLEIQYGDEADRWQREAIDRFLGSKWKLVFDKLVLVKGGTGFCSASVKLWPCDSATDSLYNDVPPSKDAQIGPPGGISSA